MAVGGVFRRRQHPIIRRRRLLSGSPVVAQTGLVGVGVTGSGSPTKIVACEGAVSVGLGGFGQAVKRVAHTATGTVGFGGSADGRKNATPTGAARVGLGGASQHSRVSPHTGRVTLLFGSTARVRVASSSVVGFATTNPIPIVKTAALSGTSWVGFGGAATPTKHAATGGRARLGFAATGIPARIAAVEAVEYVRFSGSATTPARVSGVAAVWLTARGAATRRVGQQGRTCVGFGTTPANVQRRAFVTGRSEAGFTTWCTSRSKIAPVTGRGFVGFSGQGVAIRVGSTTGTRVSPPMALPDLPVSGSLISWDATVPDGAGLLVETSVDNGATWQPATNNQPIPRLTPGLVLATTVLSRVTLTRQTGFDPSPRLHRLEVRVSCDGSRTELVQLGRFLINEVTIQDSPEGCTVEIAGADLSRKIDRNRWDRTVIVSEGTLVTNAIKQLARNRFPSVVLNFVTSNQVTPRLFYGEQAQNSPWQDMLDLARDIGCELFFDAFGVLTLRKVPDPAVDVSVFEADDRSHPTITDLTRRVTDDNTFNYVIVTGESSFNKRPVRGYAIDRDPASPTYALGPYGIVTLRVVSPSVVTASQAFEAAEALLRRYRGATESVDLSMIPMPALEPSDVITVTRDRSKVDGRFVLEAVRVPLSASEPMRALCRRQRY